ncbi:hypothetical protein OEIGOIKO_01145 [Streptomyces chrestomyceticus JCM 4735]|uniref:Uncharacterized protein n=1 Tax=Streptomyces chrestomyceticus JCM 4735 TaxID=1306181 RepID=A0A7U9PWC4_9ACTN|nr:hypothetical protein [Streptomyces chrestomyceticus]GCD33425.1 hypothetical protein OEIGOIKO_01145 [Streptomyces chrestomyceticus JCM 4735]
MSQTLPPGQPPEREDAPGGTPADSGTAPSHGAVPLDGAVPLPSQGVAGQPEGADRPGTDMRTKGTVPAAADLPPPVARAAPHLSRPGVRLVAVPLAVTLGLLTVAALGTGFVGRFGAAESPEARAFTSLLEFDLWSALVGASIALYVAVAYAMSYAVRRRWRQPIDRPAPRAVAVLVAGAAVLLGAVFGILRFFTPPDSVPVPLDGLAWRVPLLLVLGMLAAAPGAVGLWDVQVRLLRLSRRLPTEPDVLAPVGALRELHLGWRDAVRFLTGGSLIISTAVVDAGALRNALLAYGMPEKSFPASSVLLYGAFFSVMFALVFLPVVVLWRSVAGRLVESTVRIPEADELTEDWIERRARLVAFLRLDISLPKVLAPAFGILAPLATGAVSLFLPGGGR